MSCGIISHMVMNLIKINSIQFKAETSKEDCCNISPYWGRNSYLFLGLSLLGVIYTYTILYYASETDSDNRIMISNYVEEFQKTRKDKSKGLLKALFSSNGLQLLLISLYFCGLTMQAGPAIDNFYENKSVTTVGLFLSGLLISYLVFYNDANFALFQEKKSKEFVMTILMTISMLSTLVAPLLGNNLEEDTIKNIVFYSSILSTLLFLLVLFFSMPNNNNKPAVQAVAKP